MKTQKGFTLVEAMLVVIALTLISFAGWYVWNEQNKDADATERTMTKKSDSQKNSDKSDPTAKWRSYDTTKFSLRYPTEWVLPKNQSLCKAGEYFLAGPTENAAGLCDSDATSQVAVHSFDTEGGPMGLDGGEYKDIETKSVTVNGVTGERHSGTFNPSEPGGLGPEAGTKVVQYVFKSGNTYYTATYMQQPGGTDTLEDFDLMVTKTLKFN